jgi:hypothetical protein
LRYLFGLTSSCCALITHKGEEVAVYYININAQNNGDYEVHKSGKTIGAIDAGLALQP